MTAPEKAAPIPADVRERALQIGFIWFGAGHHEAAALAADIEQLVAEALLTDRAARPSAVEEPAPTSEAEEQDALRLLGEAKALIEAAAFSRTVLAARPDLNAALEKLETIRARLRKGGAHGE